MILGQYAISICKRLSSLQNSVPVTFNPHIFDSALKKVPARVESCAWARSVRFLQRNIVRWAQRHDLAYFRDATGVMPREGIPSIEHIYDMKLYLLCNKTTLGLCAYRARSSCLLIAITLKRISFFYSRKKYLFFL